MSGYTCNPRYNTPSPDVLRKLELSFIELSYTLNASTDYLLLGRNPDRNQDRKLLLQVISQLSDIARNM